MKNNIIHKPYAKLKGWLRENGITYDRASEMIGISSTTFCQKINGTSDFYLSEINLLKKNYNLTNDIFFTDDVAKR